MLTDIFATRYEGRVIWQEYTEAEQKLLVQCFRIVDEDLFRYYGTDGKTDEASKARWTSIHDKLSRELGLKELSAKYYSFQAKSPSGTGTYTNSGWWGLNYVCEQFVLAKYDSKISADRHMKERISFVELAFRERELVVASENAKLPKILMAAVLWDKRPKKSMTLPGSQFDAAKAQNETLNRNFNDSVHELNARFTQARAGLSYHNGLIQIAKDALTEAQIAEPFWKLVKDPKWVNVDIDMKEALDRLETADRDPAFYAAKALESVIKVICEERKWTTGKEGGVGDFLKHLELNAFVAPWERVLMQRYFSGVRNALGHGPGNERMPALSEDQATFATEFCMSWIKSLINRLKPS